MLNEVLLAALSGLLVGVVFTAVKLPIPAPPVLSGVIGIVGVYLGSVIYTKCVTMFFS
ncbi:XapX domain-containing protein [Aliivibrio kagoshimensis]|uniref:XapX domain-containing protein n=1 Tax=Aliivibrio TaxID=511678 RepID=UPI001A394072|nr:XapX domain-containing protein [Aliivibrio sp.]